MLAGSIRSRGVNNTAVTYVPTAATRTLPIVRFAMDQRLSVESWGLELNVYCDAGDFSFAMMDEELPTTIRSRL